jgi:hypothetical protein
MVGRPYFLPISLSKCEIRISYTKNPDPYPQFSYIL